MFTVHQQLNSAALLNTNQALTDLQFSQILTQLSSSSLVTPEKGLQLAALHGKRYPRTPRIQFDAFWLTPLFMAWNNIDISSLIIIKGNLKSRDSVTSFFVDSVELGRAAGVTMLWAFRQSAMEGTQISIVELLKYLTAQVLRQTVDPTDSSLRLSCAKYQQSDTEHTWIDLLAARLSELQRVYILIDMELLNPELLGLFMNHSLTSAFCSIFRKVSEINKGTVIKVALASYGSAISKMLHKKEAPFPILQVNSRSRAGGPCRIPDRAKWLSYSALRGRFG